MRSTVCVFYKMSVCLYVCPQRSADEETTHSIFTEFARTGQQLMEVKKCLM